MSNSITYDGTKSATSAENIMDFLDGFNHTPKITDVPGVGSVSASNFVGHAVTTPQQLLAKYLSFAHEGAGVSDVNTEFFRWVKEANPKVNAHTITFAVAHLADKFGLVKYED